MPRLEEVGYSIRLETWTLDYAFGRNVLEPTQHSEFATLCVAGRVLSPKIEDVDHFEGRFETVPWTPDRVRGDSDKAIAGNLEKEGDVLNGRFIIPIASLPPVTNALSARVVRYLYLAAPKLRYRKSAVSEYRFIQTAFGEIRPEDLVADSSGHLW